MISEEEKRNLLVEIFDITGQKLDAEDPAVVAAFFYSTKLRQALDQNRLSCEAIVINTTKTLNQAVNTSIAALENSAKAHRNESERIYARMLDQARLAARSEVPAIKRELSEYAKSTFAKLFSGDKANPKVSLFAFVVTSILMIFMGVAIGATWFQSGAQLTREQSKSMSMGRAISKVIPLLDQSTREKLTALLQNNE
jgi:hypothetical protein